MRIEYVLIEKQEEQQKPSKRRINALLRKQFPDISSNIIYIQGKRKKFEVNYKITCCAATDDGSNDNIYNISLEVNHNDKNRCIELLEQVNRRIIDLINTDPNYHIIIANDELSEYFCNKAYPKYQHFERQLRHLIFNVVTKAYGNMWAKVTFSEELRKKLKEDVKTYGGNKREEVLIEQALHEMTMAQLIDYLFYGPCEIDIVTELDEHYPSKKLKELSNDELVELIEKSRRKSVWNMFLANDIDIDEPKEKLTVLKNNRNNVAHCKQFYLKDYKKTTEYIDIFVPKIELAIENATIADDVSIRSVLLGFGEYTVGLANIAANIGQTIAPALQRMADISASITAALRSEVVQSIVNATSSIGNMLAQNIMNNYPSFNAISTIQENMNKLLLPSLTNFEPAENDEITQYECDLTEPDDE